ncbi:MAG: signal peptidase II [Ignavibacteriaceae bacterium]
MRVLIVSLAVVLLDQVSKLLVKGISIPRLGIDHQGMYPGQRINLLGDWLNITFVENPGIAFGIDFGGGYKLLISLFTIAATIGLFVYLYIMRQKSFALRLSLALIIGGAVGNLIDRAFYGMAYDYAPFLYGMVVDFIDIRMFNLFIFSKTIGSYVLNFADLSVTTGVILLLFSYSREKESESETFVPPVETENALAENKE